MADRIVYNDNMENVAGQIEELATRYQSIGTSFVSDVIAAFAEWEGDSRVAMERLMNGPVNNYVATTIPEILNAFAQTLRDNKTYMQTTDNNTSAEIDKLTAALGA